MRKIVLILISAILASGCATQKTYYHPTKHPSQIDADWYACQRVAEQRTANLGYTGNPLLIRQYAQECMEIEKGWIEQP